MVKVMGQLKFFRQQSMLWFPKRQNEWLNCNVQKINIILLESRSVKLIGFSFHILESQ